MQLCVAAELVWEKFVLAGFTVNFAVEKTAALIRWHGPGADTYRAHFVHTLNNQVELKLRGLSATLHVVPVYKHLGTLVSARTN